MMSDQGDLVISGRIGDIDPVPTAGRFPGHKVGIGARSVPQFSYNSRKAPISSMDTSGLRDGVLSFGPKRSRASIRDEVLERTLVARERGDISDEAFQAVDDILHNHA
jgi:hypothetical protein